MSSLSLFARRSVMTMAGRRLVLPSAMKPSVARSLSTQTESQVHAVEDMLVNLHWDYLKDDVEVIRQLLNEKKTNKSIREPGAVLEDKVANMMQEIQEMIAANPSPNRFDVESRVCGLKRQVKNELYA